MRTDLEKVLTEAQRKTLLKWVFWLEHFDRTDVASVLKLPNMITDFTDVMESIASEVVRLRERGCPEYLSGNHMCVDITQMSADEQARYSAFNALKNDRDKLKAENAELRKRVEFYRKDTERQVKLILESVSDIVKLRPLVVASDRPELEKIILELKKLPEASMPEIEPAPKPPKYNPKTDKRDHRP